MYSLYPFPQIAAPLLLCCGEASAFLQSTTRLRRIALPHSNPNPNDDYDDEDSSFLFQKEILSRDPLVYTVPNLLTPEECVTVQNYVQQLEQGQQRTLTLSNPPQVSLDSSKLWPLPFLSLLAGVPPILRTTRQEEISNMSLDQILITAAPNVCVALLVSALLAYGVVLPLLRLQAQSTARTSVALALNLEEDFDLIRPIVDRICHITGHSFSLWEAPVATRYDPGAVFAKHGDASPTRGSEWKDSGGQRLVTCICYLNTLGDGGGGETYFDQLSLAVEPRQGQALFFYPASADSWVADDRVTHESLPPNSEEKWILQLFGRAQRVPPPLGLPDSYGNQKDFHDVVLL